MSQWYEPSAEQIARRQRNFTYHAPSTEQVQRMRDIREHAKNLSCRLDSSCPPSRELDHAQDALQYVLMWANAAIARYEAVAEPQ